VHHPKFKSNYPNFVSHEINVLSTPTRVNAYPDLYGDNVVMAYVDSGFSRHAEIEGRVIVHADASTNHIIETPHVVEVSPLSWHGQMTSVIGSGDGSKSGGRFRGIASKSKLVLVKVSTPEGRIKEADILRGLRWLYDTRHRYGVRIINVSVGGDYHSDDPQHPLHVMVKKLVKAGIVVLISAGNANLDTLVPPASAPDALTIGGYDDHNNLDSSHWTLFHHNHGKTYNGLRKPELLAPAAWIASPLLPGSDTANEIYWLGKVLDCEKTQDLLNILKESAGQIKLEADISKVSDQLLTELQSRIYHHKVISSDYQHVDGTSVAAPITASVIAQMLQVNPKLQPNDVRHILAHTSSHLTHLPLDKQGAGKLNPRKAVDMARDFVSSIRLTS
jgi:serine protease AprX